MSRVFRPPGFHLAYLADHPHHLPRVARWLMDEFGPPFADDAPLAKWEERIRGQMQRDAMPLNVVALEGTGDGRGETTVLLGTAALLDSPSAGVPHYAPRLGLLYVTPEHRGRGLGSALTRRIEAEAARLGHRRLYLYATDAEGLYARLGWRVVERFPWRDGRPAAAMAIDLAG